jgi:hypothetical protein
LSRRCVGLLTGLLAASALLAPQTSPAQGTPDEKTVQVMATARAAVGPISPEQARKACEAQDKQGDIIVCASVGTKQFRVQSTAELNPNSRASTRTGVPRAPKFDGEACDTKLITCLGFGRKRDAMYFIDLASIPPTPTGSDAEKVANGEMSDR